MVSTPLRRLNADYDILIVLLVLAVSVFLVFYFINFTFNNVDRIITTSF